MSSLDDILRPQSAHDYEYLRDKYKYIIGLMKKFELCYVLDDDRILVPDLLEVQEPEIEFEFGTALRFVLDYDDFLPKSVLPRFIVRTHQDIQAQLRWRTGVVLTDEAFESTAVIRADMSARRIYIFVNGR